jgi:hypothetical protein
VHAPTIAAQVAGGEALYAAAAAVLVAFITAAGGYFTQVAARRSPSLPSQPLTPMPAADSGHRPTTAPGTVAACCERALEHAERELHVERATTAGLRHLLAMARGYIRVLLAFISRYDCGTPPEPPAGLDIDSP